MLHLIGDLFELYDDARTYKPQIHKQNLLFFPPSNPVRLWATVRDNGSNTPSVFSRVIKRKKSDFQPSI